jgi:hypothetical protein
LSSSFEGVSKNAQQLPNWFYLIKRNIKEKRQRKRREQVSLQKHWVISRASLTNDFYGKTPFALRIILCLKLSFLFLSRKNEQSFIPTRVDYLTRYSLTLENGLVEFFIEVASSFNRA